MKLHEIIFLVIIIVNTIISVLYIILKGVITRTTESILKGIIMLLVPLAGIAYFGAGWLLNKLSIQSDEMDLEGISFSKVKVDYVTAPDIDQEMDTVPLEESFLVSGTEDKRRALLDKLKRDFDRSLGSISKALDDDDPETSHYAASVISRANDNFISTLRGFAIEYAKDPTDRDINREYADYTLKYLHSGILSEMEMRKYSYDYINLMENLQRNHPQTLFVDDYANITNAYIDVGDFYEAEKWALRSVTFFPQEEQSYLSLLKVYHTTGQTQKFMSTIDDMKASGAPLTEQGLSLIRFVMAKDA